MASGPITSQQIWGNNEKNWETLFLGGSKITADGDCRHEIKRRLFLGRKAMANLDSITNSRDITLLTKVLMVKAMAFAVVMERCESWTIRKGWALNNWCFWTAVLKTLESPFDSKEITPVNPKESHFWIFIGRTEAEAEAPILPQPDVKSQHIWKTLMLEKIEGRRRRGQ